MEQLEFFDIPSPCVNICTANAKGYCEGCFRTRDERFYWQKLTNGQKRDVLRACRIRRIRAKREAQAPQVETETTQENLSLF